MSKPADDPSASPAGDQSAFLPPVTPLSGAGPAESPAADTRPELVVGAAFAGGLILAKLLGRLRGR